jgi:hypothetical protein
MTKYMHQKEPSYILRSKVKDPLEYNLIGLGRYMVKYDDNKEKSLAYSFTST